MKRLIILSVLAVIFLAARELKTDKVIVPEGSASDPSLQFDTAQKDGFHSSGIIGLGLAINETTRHTFTADTYTLTAAGDANLVVSSTALTTTDSGIFMGPVGDTNQAVVFYDDSADEMQLFAGDTHVFTVSDLVNPSIYKTASAAGSTSACWAAASAGRTAFSTCSSSIKYKEKVKTLDDSYTVDRLRPVEFHWKSTGAKDIGLIAEEVDKVYPHLVEKNANGVEGVKYRHMLGLAIIEIQRLKKRVQELEER